MLNKSCFRLSFSIPLTKKSQVSASFYLWMWCRFTMLMCLNKTLYIQLWKPQTLECKIAKFANWLKDRWFKKLNLPFQITFNKFCKLSFHINFCKFCNLTHRIISLKVCKLPFSIIFFNKFCKDLRVFSDYIFVNLCSATNPGFGIWDLAWNLVLMVKFGTC